MQYADDLPAVIAPRHEENSDHANLLIVFVDYTECRYLRWLKQGFRHCFVVMRSQERWIVCDPLKNCIEFSTFNIPIDFDLSDFYRSRGHIVVAGSLSGQRQAASLLPEFLTCVSIAKRIVGIQSFWTFTPWQLFRLLVSEKDRWRLVG